MAALALLVAVLLFAPIGATQGGQPSLSPTPPVTLLAPSTTPTTTTTNARQLPKTGLDAWLVALAGVGLVAAGEALRRAIPRPRARRSG